MLALIAATAAVSKNRFPTTRGASAPPPPPAGASRAGYPPAEEYARAQKEALARKYSGNATAAQPPPYIGQPVTSQSNAWARILFAERQIQQNTAWVHELDHGCADGLRELDERMAKLEKTLERMEDWAEQVGKHLGRRLEPG